MATALTPSSSNNRQWWPRLSATKEPSSYVPAPDLYTDISSYIGGRPHTSPGPTRHPFMTSVTNSATTSPNAFMVSSKSSSRFNLAAVIGFGSRSKKQQSLDIQEPPQHVPSPPISNPNSTDDFTASPQSLVSPQLGLSPGVASSVSGTSRASTDGPLTPADDPSSPGLRTSYQQSLMTLTDTDPFSTTPLNDRRLSAHSDKSLSRRLMQKIDGKSAKTNSVRPPMGDAPKEGRDRSATLPTRTRTSDDIKEAYQPLRAVEPPWATSDLPESHFMTLPSKPAKGGPTVRHYKSGKSALPWPQTREKGSPPAHQRKNSSSSISKDPLTDVHRHHTSRPSTSSSTHFSPTSATFFSHFPASPSRSRTGSGQSADVRHVAMPSLSGVSSAKTLLTLPTHFGRASPRPPPTTELPPTPTPPPQMSEHYPLRSRSGTIASASSASFASTLSSLSFNSRPSPQEPPSVGTYDYPSLMDETLPVAVGVDSAVPRRGSNFRLSTGSHKDSKARGPVPPPANSPTQNTHIPKPVKAGVLTSRPLPSPPGILPLAGASTKRERTLSALLPSSDTGRTLRKQRSFHNTSHHAPAPLTPTLRHYNSFDPSNAPGSDEQKQSPPLPALGSPSFPPLQDSPPHPPTLPSIPKRVSTGKDSTTSSSPRRKLFGVNKHDRDRERERERERERKHELDHVDTTTPMNASSAGLSSTSSSALGHSSSSWFDDRGTGSEPASATSASPLTSHDVAQHIVPPAELLRLGAAWERENESRIGLRRAKSSWGSRESDTSRTSAGSSSSKTPAYPFPRNGSSSPLLGAETGSKLPRSASLLSKANSAPSFSRSRGGAGAPPDLSFAPSSSTLPPESYTSLSPPPPRRQHRASARTFPQGSSGFSSALRRTPSASATSSRSSPPAKGALIERKPSFLDMTTTRQSVTIDAPEIAPGEHEDYERDSFLELSRGMDSIDTIRESVSSVDSFMQ